METLTITGETRICGSALPIICGRFEVGNKAILVKHIAEIHSKKLLRVNEAINNNRMKFKDNVDIIDLKYDKFAKLLVDKGYLTQNSLNASKNVYLLSESGYRILCNIFEDATISIKVLTEYFDSSTGVVIFAEKRKEILFRKEVDKIFDGLCTVCTQYNVDGYKIDLYIPELNVAIEFDENAHSNRTKEDKERQIYIEDKLACKFIRIKETEDYASAVNVILKTLFGERGMTERDILKLIFKSKTEKSWEMYEQFLDEVFQ